MFEPLNDDVLSLVSGGRTNAEHPGVQAALNAFYGVLYCGGSIRRPRSPFQTARLVKQAADPFRTAPPLEFT